MAWKFFDSAGNLLGLGQPGVDGVDGAPGADGTTMPDGTNPGDILAWDGDSWEILAIGDDDKVLTADSGEALGLKWAAGGGGATGTRYPVQEKASGNASTNSAAATLGATPTTGNIIVLVSYSEGTQNISSITQTNVSWSKLAESTASTAPHCEIWVGVVGGSPGTLITVAYSSTAYCGWGAQEWDDLAGTLDQSAVKTNSTNHYIPLITPTVATALVISGAAESTFGGGFDAFVGPQLMMFGARPGGGGAAAWGFPGTNGVVGSWPNSHGGTYSAVTVSIV